MEELLQSVLEILVCRTGQLQALEQALLEGQAAILESSLDRMDRAQERQRSICQQVAALDADLVSTYRAFESAAQPFGGAQGVIESMGPGIVGRADRIFLAHEKLQGRVRELSGVQRALLRRSERTLRAMQSVIASQHLRYGTSNAGYGPVQGRNR